MMNITQPMLTHHATCTPVSDAPKMELRKLANGMNGYVEANWLTPMKVRKLSLTCSKNFVELDYTAQAITISSATVRSRSADARQR